MPCPPTRLLEGRVETGPPYPGAKDAFVLTERECQDPALMARVITACRDDLAPARKKAKKAAKSKSENQPS